MRVEVKQLYSVILSFSRFLLVLKTPLNFVLKLLVQNWPTVIFTYINNYCLLPSLHHKRTKIVLLIIKNIHIMHIKFIFLAGNQVMSMMFEIQMLKSFMYTKSIW